MEKALIYDLDFRAAHLLPEGDGGKMIDIIRISAYTIIRREGKLYKVKVMMDYEIGAGDDWVTNVNHCMNSFIEQCEKCSKGWKLRSEEDSVVEGLMGKVILQEPFEI